MYGKKSNLVILAALLLLSNIAVAWSASIGGFGATSSDADVVPGATAARADEDEYVELAPLMGPQAYHYLMGRPSYYSGQLPNMNLYYPYMPNTKAAPAETDYIRVATAKRSPMCLRKCMSQGFLHPAQCHSLC